MPKVNVGSPEEIPVEIYYSVTGLGPHKILFISGLGAIAHQWDLQVSLLSFHTLIPRWNSFLLFLNFLFVYSITEDLDFHPLPIKNIPQVC
jgi:hypothetical protein